MLCVLADSVVVHMVKRNAFRVVLQKAHMEKFELIE